MPQPPHRPIPGAFETGEFDRHDDVARIAVKHLGFEGRCYGSMSEYRARNVDHLTIKNANVCTREHGKIWWGDLDVTETVGELRALARELGVIVFVLREMEARFENADAPRLHNASYATDWHQDGFLPTLTWSVQEQERRRRALLRAGDN